jgi:uroporphyrin-III C-methyltransferase / precorrin-2 dehydrogenase / sirohydrochlorin ferrochelatase
MRFLPVFLDVQAGPVVLVGTGELASAKLRVLASAGARVRWYATAAGSPLSGLAPQIAARVEMAAGDPLTADLAGVIAIVCAGAGEMGIAMSTRAKALGLPVNVVDDLVHSTFIFPAIVDRGEVVVAVGTGGASPVVARRVRERIEAMLPQRIGDLAQFIGAFRKLIHERIGDVSLRRRFWERVIDGPIGALVLDGRRGEAEAVLNRIVAPADFADAQGSVTIVNAGPGDPDLLTIKALRALQDADVVFHDEGICGDILDRIRRDAARVAIAPGMSQSAINKQLIDAATSGRRAVRLKGADAFGSGRGPEELAALREAGVSFFVVPGVVSEFGEIRPFASSQAVWRAPRQDIEKETEKNVKRDAVKSSTL